jgi:hypothetical protein
MGMPGMGMPGMGMGMFPGPMGMPGPVSKASSAYLRDRH